MDAKALAVRSRPDLTGPSWRGTAGFGLRVQGDYTFVAAGQQADRRSGLLGGVCNDKPMYVRVRSATSACMRLEQADTDLGGTTQPGRKRVWFSQKRRAGLHAEWFMPGGGGWSRWTAVW